MNIMHGHWPGVVMSYNGAARECRVSIPGLTDGSDVLPLAAFSNPLGDRPEDTEIRILVGDKVWLEFECGDPRFPIITGYRTPRAGNPTGWRRWRHQNIQLTAENQFVITLGGTTITVTDGLIDIQGADMYLAGNLLVAKTLMVAMGISGGADIVASGNIGDQGGTKTMANMRAKYNGHAGHFDNQNVTPINQM